MGQIRGREKRMVVGNHAGKKESQGLLVILMFEFPLWILGACGRKGFNQGCDMIRAAFGERKYCWQLLGDGFKRSKSSCRKTFVTFEYVRLKVSDRISQPR